MKKLTSKGSYGFWSKSLAKNIEHSNIQIERWRSKVKILEQKTQVEQINISTYNCVILKYR